MLTDSVTSLPVGYICFDVNGALLSV